MRPTVMVLPNRWMLLVSLVLCSPASRAASPPRASLACFIDGTGNASASLLIGALLPQPEALSSDLGQALGTGARDIDLDIDTEKHVVRCAIRSTGHFPAHAHQVRGEIRIAPLLPPLQAVGVTQMEIQLTHPRAAFSQCSSLTQTRAAKGGPWIDYFGTVPLAGASVNAVRFQFGYRDRDLLVAFLPLLIVAPLPVVWAWRRKRRPGPTSAEKTALQVLGIPALLAWTLWALLLAALQADVIAFFLTGLVQPTERALGSIALLVLPPAVALGAARGLLNPPRRRLLATIPPGQVALRDSLPGLLPWMLPALLSAIGLAAWRDAGPGPARAWWASAGAAIGVILGQRAWINGLGSAARSAGRDESFALQRLARTVAIRRWWTATAMVVGVPVFCAWVIRRCRIDQPTSSLVAGAALLLTLAVLRWFHGASKPKRSLVVIAVLLRIGLARIGCLLLELPLDLEHGDEGLVALTCVTVAAILDGLTDVRSFRPPENTGKQGSPTAVRQK